MDNLVERSRKTSDQVLELVRHEVATQLKRIDGKSLEAIANQVADILKKSAEAGRSATKDVTDARPGSRQPRTAKGVPAADQDGHGRTKAAKRRAGHQAAKAPPRPGRPPPARGRRQGGRTAKKAAAHKASAKKAPERHKTDGQEGRQLSSRDPPPARHRAGAAGPGADRQRGPGGHRRRQRPRRRRPGREGGPPRRAGRAGRRCWARRRPSSAAAARSSMRRSTRFAVAVAGRRALDAGASTGGFTDCLLQRGAAHVYAVDVGHGQLDPALRADRRVTCPGADQCADAEPRRAAAADPAFEPCSLVVADLSFISLRSVVPALAGPVAAPGADLVLLVKPQFEAGRAAVSRGKGVVRDPAVWRARSRVWRPRSRCRNRHHGGDGFPPDRRRRQRRVPAARPQGAPGSPSDEATALFAPPCRRRRTTCRRATPAD